jgi:hypothetical protein
MFRHVRPSLRGALIANVLMDAERGNQLIAQALGAPIGGPTSCGRVGTT